MQGGDTRAARARARALKKAQQAEAPHERRKRKPARHRGGGRDSLRAETTGDTSTAAASTTTQLRVQLQEAQSSTLTPAAKRDWQRKRRQLARQELHELRAARARAEAALLQAREAQRAREAHQRLHADDEQREREAELMQVERDAVDAAEAAEANRWATQELHDYWERNLSGEALARHARRTASGAKEKVGKLRVQVELTSKQVGTFAEKVGAGEWESAQSMMPPMLQGLIGSTDQGPLVSVAAVASQSSALLQEVRGHAARMEAVRAPWTKLTARLLTPEQKRRVTRMWDYVITFLVDMYGTFQTHHRMPKHVVDLVGLVLKDLRSEVVVPFIRLTKRAAVVAAGRGGDVHAAALREDVTEFMTGLRRLQALMLKLDWALSSNSGAASALHTIGNWIGAAFQSVLSVATHRGLLMVLQGTNTLNMMLFKTQWMGGSVFQGVTQWLATKSWSSLVLEPRVTFLKDLGRAYRRAADAYAAARDGGVTGEALQALRQAMLQADAAIHTATNQGGMNPSPWRERIARLIFRALRSVSNGSWTLPEELKDDQAFKVDIDGSMPWPKFNVAQHVKWPDEEDVAGAAGWGYRVLTFPYTLTVKFVTVMLRLLGRVLTGNLWTGSDEWAERVPSTAAERDARGWWRGLLGSDDPAHDSILFTILKSVFVIIVFPMVVQFLFGLAKGAVARLFNSASAVTAGVVNDREQWQCDAAAGVCRAVLIPRDRLGATFTSRKACDRACQHKADPIEDAYYWEMQRHM